MYRCDLDRGVPHLVSNVDERSAILDEQRTERVSQIVQPDLADAGFGQHGNEDRW